MTSTCLTLPKITISIDENMFADGQVYVALSRAKSLDKLQILKFDFIQVKCLKDAMKEYKRLHHINVNQLIENRQLY